MKKPPRKLIRTLTREIRNMEDTHARAARAEKTAELLKRTYPKMPTAWFLACCGLCSITKGEHTVVVQDRS